MVVGSESIGTYTYTLTIGDVSVQGGNIQSDKEGRVGYLTFNAL